MLVKEDGKERRVATSTEFLKHVIADNSSLDRTKTFDETGLHYFEPEENDNQTPG
jgi:hypothetical protein